MGSILPYVQVKNILFSSIFFVFLPLFVNADVLLPAIFSDHMVLQADISVPVWGWADPGEKVEVTICNISKSVVADNTGKWKAVFDTLKPGTDISLTVKGNNIINVKDVLVGQVWLCAGQSNMAFTVGGQERPNDANFPHIRLFREDSLGEASPSEKCSGQWRVCSPESIKEFSGTAYFFGKNLHLALNQPIGLVVSAVGGTEIEKWTRFELQKDNPKMMMLVDEINKKASTYKPDVAKQQYEKRLAAYEESVAKAKADGTILPKPKDRPKLQRDPRCDLPGNLFNGKIAPLAPYGIRGIIWYQGEANAQSPAEATHYSDQFATLIADYRKLWGRADLPFGWVQLPKFQHEKFLGWRELRESQLKTLRLPNTGMAITVDTGDAVKIHPDNKKVVGHRLALWARATVYSHQVPYSGPIFNNFEKHGNEIICSFSHVNGLQMKGPASSGFQIAGNNKKWVPAIGKIVNEKVIVFSPEIADPIAVRYAWDDVPNGNLFNAAELPASPFRTDNW